MALHGYLLLALIVVNVIDSVALWVLWGERGKPDFDHIAVSLTIFQTLFGIAALYGFWALRGLTKERAEATAEEEVRKLAPPLIRRQVAEALQTLGNEAPISDADLAHLVAAMGGKEGDNGDRE